MGGGQGVWRVLQHLAYDRVWSCCPSVSELLESDSDLNLRDRLLEWRRCKTWEAPGTDVEEAGEEWNGERGSFASTLGTQMPVSFRNFQERESHRLSNY